MISDSIESQPFNLFIEEHKSKLNQLTVLNSQSNKELK